MHEHKLMLFFAARWSVFAGNTPTPHRLMLPTQVSLHVPSFSTQRATQLSSMP